MDEAINYADPSASTNKAAVEKTHDLLVPLETPQKLGVALVGLGQYSSEQLAPALLETKFCRLAGIVTGDETKIAAWKNKYSIPDTNIYNYTNFDAIKDNPDIDIVYIALPNVLHLEYVTRAAKAGKHVICEKPMALSSVECDDMIAACKEAGKLLSIGYRLHFDPNHQEVISIAREKKFGELTYLHAQHGRSDANGWRLDKSLAGGGPLMDLGIYCIQAVCYVTSSDPIAVRVTKSTLKDDADPNSIEDFLAWEMEMPGGLVAQCETAYNTDLNLVSGKADHGWFELSPAYSYKGIQGKTATGFINCPPVNQQALQMDDFAFSILHKKPVKLPGEMGKRDVKIIEAIYDSMKSGERVEIKW